jgi:hypothetical protein
MCILIANVHKKKSASGLDRISVFLFGPLCLAAAVSDPAADGSHLLIITPVSDRWNWLCLRVIKQRYVYFVSTVN